MKTNKYWTAKWLSIQYAIYAYWNAIAPTQFDLKATPIVADESARHVQYPDAWTQIGKDPICMQANLAKAFEMGFRYGRSPYYEKDRLYDPINYRSEFPTSFDWLNPKINLLVNDGKPGSP